MKNHCGAAGGSTRLSTFPRYRPGPENKLCRDNWATSVTHCCSTGRFEDPSKISYTPWARPEMLLPCGVVSGFADTIELAGADVADPTQAIFTLRTTSASPWLVFKETTRAMSRRRESLREPHRPAESFRRICRQQAQGAVGRQLWNASRCCISLNANGNVAPIRTITQRTGGKVS